MAIQTLRRVVLGCFAALQLSATASAEAVAREASAEFPFTIGVFFPCSHLQAGNPDLQLPLDCVATERVTYRGSPAALIAVRWGEELDVDVIGRKGEVFFVAMSDGSFERLDGLRDLSLWPGSPNHRGRYQVFADKSGLQQFWRTNLNPERVFQSVLSTDHGRLCITSRLVPPYVGTISQCAGEDARGEFRESDGIISFAQAIGLARKALEKKPGATLRTHGFPAVYSDAEPFGTPSTYATYNTTPQGGYWAMTYRAHEAGFLIRVFFDGEVEVEDMQLSATYALSIVDVR